MLHQFVIPTFSSRHGHLRSKACWVTGHYADIEFKDGTGHGPTFQTFFELTVKALEDPELPVSSLRPAIRIECHDHGNKVQKDPFNRTLWLPGWYPSGMLCLLTSILSEGLRCLAQEQVSIQVLHLDTLLFMDLPCLPFPERT